MNTRIISIIIPFYNEESTIIKTLQEIELIKINQFEIEVTCIDDASSDKGSSLVKEFLKKSTLSINLITLKKNSGKGFAVRKGIESSRGDLIIIQDADMELIPTDIPEMVYTLINLQVNFVNGSRYMPGIIRPLYSYRRYIFNKLFTYFTNIFVDVRLTDMACGYKLFTRELYNQINLKENRFGIEAELLIKAMRLDMTKITEIPVHYYPRNKGEGKKITNLDGVRIFFTIIKYGLLNMR